MDNVFLFAVNVQNKRSDDICIRFFFKTDRSVVLCVKAGIPKNNKAGSEGHHKVNANRTMGHHAYGMNMHNGSDQFGHCDASLSLYQYECFFLLFLGGENTKPMFFYIYINFMNYSKLFFNLQYHT